MTQDRLRVVYWNNQPTPYVVARLNAVVDRDDVDLEVWFDVMREDNRSWTLTPDDWRFRWQLVPAGGVPIALLESSRPDVLVCNYDQRRMAVSAVVARTLARRLCLRVLPPYSAQAEIGGGKRLIWRILFSLVDGAKVPGPEGARFAARHGIPRTRSWRVTQSIDVAHYASARPEHPANPAACGEPARFVVVSRLVPSKGIDVLLEAWRQVRAELPGSTLVVAGDGSDEFYFRELAADLPEVSWLGFVEPADLPATYAGTDVLIFPTLGDPNGLVVEEAMAAGLAVISSDAAGDIRDRVPDDAGWVVPAGDPAALAAAMAAAGQLGRAELARIGSANAQRAKAFDPTAYAADFSRFCTEVSTLPARRTTTATAARVASFSYRAARRRRARSARSTAGATS